MMTKQLGKQLTNVFLRVLSLASKMLLTLYMGRYLGLAEIGVYGLVFASVTIISGALGLRLDYVVARDLVSLGEHERIKLIRDQIVFLLWNYVVFAVVTFGGYVFGVADGVLLLIVFVISMFDSLACAMATNLVAMGNQLTSTALFFMRSGLWCLLAVGFGMVFPAFRSVYFILSLWAVGEFLALICNALVWRRLAWAAIRGVAVDWTRIWHGVRLCFPMWLGTIGAMLALSIDRFVVEHFLTLEDVGVITFYSSFAVALLSLVQSGFFAFLYPTLIDHHRRGDTLMFWKETRRTALHVALFVFVSACVIGVVIPLSASLFDKPRLASEALTLWLLLFGIWIRVNADTFYYVLYARNQDRPLWIGSVLFLIPAALGNLLFVPWLGLPGAGVSSILACTFLLLWRVHYVFAQPKNFSHENKCGLKVIVKKWQKSLIDKI